MIYIGPTAGEKFYLRTLLMVTRGPKSFDDLRTVDGTLCKSFHEACLKRGLLEDDGEWLICLQDAAEIQTGSQLRHLFATLLLFCAPAEPKKLWLQFQEKICDDLHHKLYELGRTSVGENEVYDFGLHLIDNILGDSGHSLSDFPSMPHPIYDWSDTINNHLISQQLNYDHQSETIMAHQFMKSMNSGQQHAFDKICQSVFCKEGKLFFIYGFGGCGKTYLYEALCHALRAEGIIICFEALDRTFQDLRNCPKRFGGLTMVFGGDFQQILPVVPSGSRAEIVNASLQKSSLWNDMQILKLEENMRLRHSPEDTSFSQWLLDIGHGRDIDGNGKVQLPQHMITHDENELILSIYGDIANQGLPPPPEYFLDHAILAPRNVDVQQTNAKILANMPGDEIVYHSADSLESDDLYKRQDDIPDDVLREFVPSSLPLSELKMKIGCPLMLLRNLDPKKGLCNGTRMILRRAYPRVLEISIIGGDHHGEQAFIPRITLKPSSRQYPFVLRRRQFPVRLCFAMTINKAQGQSLKYVGIHLLSPVFCHGQLYVALSRATCSSNIKILILLPGSDTKTMNVVYQEVLLD